MPAANARAKLAEMKAATKRAAAHGLTRYRHTPAPAPAPIDTPTSPDVKSLSAPIVADSSPPIQRPEKEIIMSEEKSRYTGNMLRLTERAKSGAYIKSATGQLRSTDELATVLDRVPATNVITLAIEVLGLPANPYSTLNVGQQSMNLRNRMRGAIKKGSLTLETIQAVISNRGLAVHPIDLEAKADRARERAEKAAAREAERAAKAAVREAAKAARAAKAAEKAEKAAKAAEEAAKVEKPARAPRGGRKAKSTAKTLTGAHLSDAAYDLGRVIPR